MTCIGSAAGLLDYPNARQSRKLCGIKIVAQRVELPTIAVRMCCSIVHLFLEIRAGAKGASSAHTSSASELFCASKLLGFPAPLLTVEPWDVSG